MSTAIVASVKKIVFRISKARISIVRNESQEYLQTSLLKCPCCKTNTLFCSSPNDCLLIVQVHNATLVLSSLLISFMQCQQQSFIILLWQAMLNSFLLPEIQRGKQKLKHKMWAVHPFPWGILKGSLV